MLEIGFVILQVINSGNLKNMDQNKELLLRSHFALNLYNELVTFDFLSCEITGYISYLMFQNDLIKCAC